MSQRAMCLIALGIAICLNSPARSAGELDRTIDWSKLPTPGTRDGAWVFSDKSMPYLLASRYDIKNIAPEDGGPLAFAKMLLSSAGADPGSKFTGLSYYLQRESELYRCDEIGIGKQYVVCWEFSPAIVEDKPVLVPNGMVGSWIGIGPFGVETWTFNQTTVRSSTTGNEPASYTEDDQGNKMIVTIKNGGQIVFTKILNKDDTFNEADYTPRNSSSAIHLKRN